MGRPVGGVYYPGEEEVMSSIEQLKGILSSTGATSIGEVTTVRNGGYTVVYVGTTVEVPSAISTVIRVGDWVAIKDGAIVGKVSNPASIPTYYV